ncbi:Aste57867_14171 [Aphanomyces stellatus]|uniref:Aste57867_14171 protein n=1 Tax=Aphanomyces stellatus TaxID=120398 RepID=A0A485L024_9STRA|nr:hypothetical protein As57867_014120 [Aphanomyces stellatus]VFT90996.1 Aste57867_14171 [Aphanomyces stellatus]
MPPPPTPSILVPAQPKPIELLDELLGTLLLLLSLAFLALVELTRRRVLALHQCAFCLASAVAVVTLGGFLEHHVPNDVLDLALRDSTALSSAALLQLRYGPAAAAAGATFAFLVYVSLCGCRCCCLVPDAASHQICMVARLRHAASVYALAFLALYIGLGMRLNARMRLSAIKPVGGTLHWQLLQVPLFLAAMHIGSLLLVVLKDVLQHAEAGPSDVPQPSSMSPPSTTQDSPSKHVQPAPLRPRSATKDVMVGTPPSSQSSGGSRLPIPARATATSRIATPPSSTTSTSSAKSTSVRRPQTLSSDDDNSSGVGSPVGPQRARSSAEKPTRRVSPVLRRPQSDAEIITSFLPPSTTTTTTPPGTPRRRRAPSAIVPPLSPTRSLVRQPTKPMKQAMTTHAGDKSNLISSESESDDDVIVPSAIRQFTSEYAASNHLVRDDASDVVGASHASPKHRHDTYHAGELDGPWMLCHDEASGASYYYNHETGESTWEKPVTAPEHTKWE